MIKAVLFDLDNTLYDYKPCNDAGIKAVTKFLSQELELPLKQVQMAYRDARDYIHKLIPLQAASHLRLLYIHHALEQLVGYPLPQLALQADQLFWQTYGQQMKLYPNVRTWLKELHQKDVKLAVVTDLTAEVQFQKLVTLGLDYTFDVIVTSEEVGREKPHPAMLRLALKKLKVSKNQAVLVGDSVRDQEAARRLNVKFYQASGAASLGRIQAQLTKQLA